MKFKELSYANERDPKLKRWFIAFPLHKRAAFRRAEAGAGIHSHEASTSGRQSRRRGRCAPAIRDIALRTP